MWKWALLRYYHQWCPQPYQINDDHWQLCWMASNVKMHQPTIGAANRSATEWWSLTTLTSFWVAWCTMTMDWSIITRQSLRDLQLKCPRKYKYSCVCVCVLCIHVSWCLVGFSKDHLSFFVFVLFVAQSTFCFCFVVVVLLCFCPCCQLSFSTKTPQSPSKHCVYEMWQICDLG